MASPASQPPGASRATSGTKAKDTFHAYLRTEVTFKSLKIIPRNTSINAGGFAGVK